MAKAQGNNQVLCAQSASSEDMSTQAWLEQRRQSIDGGEKALLNGGVSNVGRCGSIKENTP